MLCSRALAVTSGRDYVTPDDVKAVAVAAPCHRLTLRPETFLRRTSGDDVVRATLGDVAVPATAALPCHRTGWLRGGHRVHVEPVLSPTTAASRCAVLAAGLVVAGLATGRADLVALAAPFLIGLVLAAGRVHARPPRTTPRLSAVQIREHDVIDATVTLSADTDLDAVRIALAAPTFLAAGPPLLRVTSVAAGAPATVHLRLRAGHRGRKHIGPVVVRGYGAGLLSQSAPLVGVPPVAVTVMPAIESFQAGEAVRRTVAYAGGHRSRVAGPGVEFAGTRPFGPGDRPRRINWRASLRTGDLHVNATRTDRAAEVLVVIDSLHNVGAPGSAILDVAVRLAAGITEHYLAAGDTVGLVEYGGENRTLEPAAGRSQLARAREWLLDVSPPLSAAAPAATGWLASLRTTRALVIALTPLLDEQAAAHLAVLRRRGVTVLAVDTLPDAEDRAGEVARRLWLLERQLLIARLGDLGVPVVRWDGPGSVDAVLHDLARLAAAPRPALR
ncbi:MAG TPA: DUF58 domain-containing protein [Streptosporangiaceae bacterium]|nr:DUF58 domain-containing protein [Streptosporangiaceae bacterium]